MTSSCRSVLQEAFRALGATSFGGEPTADEIDGGLAAMTDVLQGLHAGRGPMRTIDVAIDYIASEDECVRVEAGANVTVTLPDSIILSDVSGAIWSGCMTSAAWRSTSGSTLPADGRLSRPPRDGCRIEIVGGTQALYFYRADLNSWVPTAPLDIDGPTPINSLYEGALAVLVAERLCDPMNISPSPTLERRIVRANSALLLQAVTPRPPYRPAYL